MANLQVLHADFLEDLEIGQGRSAKTVENYDHYLKRFYEVAKPASPRDISADLVREFRKHLNEKFEVSAATQNYHLIALRQFLKYLARRDIVSLAPDKIGLAKLSEREIDVLYPEEIDRLLTAAEKVALTLDLGSKRDFAILQLLYSTGMRVSEAVGLNRDDVQGKDEFPVRGKGGKVRVVFVSSPARSAIEDYLKRRSDTDPAVFIAHKKGVVGSMESRRITTRSVQRAIKKYAALAGLTKPVTPHTLRHSFATDLLSNGADVRQVQLLLGHASITTTQQYTHLTDVHLKEVHEKFHGKR